MPYLFIATVDTGSTPEETVTRESQEETTGYNKLKSLSQATAAGGTTTTSEVACRCVVLACMNDGRGRPDQGWSRLKWLLATCEWAMFFVCVVRLEVAMSVCCSSVDLCAG